VAMWRPMEIYLYDWWPLRRRSKIFAKLSHMPVEVVPKRNGVPIAPTSESPVNTIRR